jgi:hypothetical protein
MENHLAALQRLAGWYSRQDVQRYAIARSGKLSPYFNPEGSERHKASAAT